MNKAYFISLVDDYIFNTKTLNESIKNAKKIGSLLWFNNIGIYGLSSQEKKLCELCYKQQSREDAIGNSDNELFIITEPFLTGGHTRLMEKLSQYCINKPDLLVTRTSSEDVVVRLESYFKVLTRIYLNENDYLSHVNCLIKKIQNYNKVILNIHPDDINTVIACYIAKKINKKLKVYFVNHADHAFVYGQTISDIWFEISEFGRRIDTLRGVEVRKSFLGIPLDISEQAGDIHLQMTGIKDGDLLVTAGAGSKFKPVKYATIKSIIHPLLDEYQQSKVCVIGVKIYKDYWWWATKLKYKDRIIFCSALPYDEYISLTSQAKGYIDSHPLPGGSAFAEQFLKGKFCIGLQGPIQGYTPIEKLKVGQFTEFIPCSSDEFNKINNMALEVHANYKVKERFLLTLEEDVLSSNLCQKLITWTGDEHFLESSHINKIPHYFSIKNAPYKILIRFSTPLSIIKFFAIKILRYINSRVRN